MDEQTANLILMRAPALSGAQLFALLAEHGSTTDILRASVAAWRNAGLNSRCVEFLDTAHDDLVANDRRWLDHVSHHLVMLGSLYIPACCSRFRMRPWACLSVVTRNYSTLRNWPSSARAIPLLTFVNWQKRLPDISASAV
jgi:predicted Rossmann fold nucleotide-binding protein DprA/Smf involved in DNA uptake